MNVMEPEVLRRLRGRQAARIGQAGGESERARERQQVTATPDPTCTRAMFPAGFGKQVVDPIIIFFFSMIDSGLPRAQKMLKGQLPRVIYHQVY